MSDELPLAAASRRLRGVPGFPRAAGRPRKHPENGPANGHVSGQANNVAGQTRTVTSENGDAESAGVQQAPVVTLERPSASLVTVAPALLSVANAGRYLGVSTRTVEGYVAAALVTPVRLPSPRSGRRLARVLLERAELDRLVEQARRRP